MTVDEALRITKHQQMRRATDGGQAHSAPAFMLAAEVERLRAIVGPLADYAEDHECDKETGIGHTCSICYLVSEAKETR